MNYTPNSTEVKQLIEGVLQRHFGCSAKEASRDQMYKATAITVKNILSDKRSAYKKKVNEAGAKRVYYMCMEFLLGRSLKPIFTTSVLQPHTKKRLKSSASIWKTFTNVNPTQDLATVALVVLPLALWILFPRSITLPQAFPSAMNTACSSK